MLPKRLFLGALLLTALVIITGCATTGKSKDLLFSRFRIADKACIRYGFVSGTDGHARCIYKMLGIKNIFDTVLENGEVNDDQEMECRTMTFTGSRIKHKVCTVKSEWAKRDKQNENKVDDFEQELKKDARMFLPPDPEKIGQMPR
jgi:hypothetical protein